MNGCLLEAKVDAFKCIGCSVRLSILRKQNQRTQGSENNWGFAGLSSADVSPRVKTKSYILLVLCPRISVLLLLLLLGRHHLAMMPSLLQSEWLRNTAAMPTCRDSASSHSLLHNAPFD